MAGDWIKMRVDLTDDPAVIGIAAATALDEFSVVGRLHRFWSWADSHTTDGNAPSVTGALAVSWIDRYVSAPGFAQALIDVGWLVVDDSGIHLPRFDRHNGKTGKQRALTAKRVSQHKAQKGNADSVTTALPREEERRDRDPPIGGSDPPKVPRGRKAGATAGNAAELIYEAYPLKAGKAAALKAIKQALKKIEFTDLLAATQAYADARRMPDGSIAEFTPYPQKWFNQERWKDDHATWKPKPTNGTGAHRRDSSGAVYDAERASREPDYGKF